MWRLSPRRPVLLPRPLSYEAVRDAVAKVFSRKGQDVVDKNIAALEAGYRHSVSR